MLKVVIKDRCVLKKWLYIYLSIYIIGHHHVKSSFGANKKCSSREFHKNGLSWTFEYDIWIELDLGKGRVEESEGRKESSTAESGE